MLSNNAFREYNGLTQTHDKLQAISLIGFKTNIQILIKYYKFVSLWVNPHAPGG